MSRLNLDLQAEQKEREKARKAAIKQAKPLFGEDGTVRGVLDKYDEEAPEPGMAIDAEGRVADERLQRQDDIRRKLADGANPHGSNGGTKPR